VELNINMEQLYHIIQVYGYKGGELITSFNMSYEEFIAELSELFIDDYVYNIMDPNLDESEAFNKLVEINYSGELLTYIFDNFSSYAGNEGKVWKLYQTVDNKMIKLSLTQTILDNVVKEFITSNI